LPTEFGEFKLIGYQDVVEHKAHFALVYGQLDPEQPTAVRVHMLDTLCDAFASKRSECGWSLQKAMQQIVREGSGAIVVLRKHEEAAELLDKIQQFQMKDLGVKSPERIREDDTKTYGLGAQIIADLNIKKLKVIGSAWRMNALSGFGLEICEVLPKQEA
jgi:3,4-dihydroxy 2-butanone 4-phosphate synthase/GTP cyclohydrolase II